MGEYPKAQRDPRSVKDLWDLHEELTELLIEIYEGIYEEDIYYYSQVLDQLLKDVIGAISECERILELKKFSDRPDWWVLKEAYHHYPGFTLLKIEWLGTPSDRERRYAAIPMDYTSAWVSVPGAAMLWKKRWKPRLEAYKKRMREARIKMEPNMPAMFSEAVGKEAWNTLRLYDSALELLADLNQYTDPHAMSFEDYQQSFMLTRGLRFNPHTREVFFRRARVSAPTKDSQEHRVWKALFESQDRPRKVTFDELREMKVGTRTIFTRDFFAHSTVRLSQWNAPFRVFGVVVLHKDGDAIILRMERGKNPKETT